MPDPRLTAGLLGPALRYSKIGLYVGPTAFLVLVALDLAKWEDDQTLLPPQIHRLLAMLLLGLSLAALVVRIGGLLMVRLRKIDFRLREQDDRYPEGYADGLARRPARNLTLVETSVDRS